MRPLGRQARIAVLWNTGFGFFGDVVQFGVTLVLVRLLAPETYGQFGLVTAVIGFINVFSFQSFVSHALQARRDEDLRYQEHFTAGAAFQLGVFAITNLVGFALRWVDAYAAVAPLIHLMSIGFLLDWPSFLRATMLARAMDWRRLRLLHGSSLVVAAALSVGLAVAGLGVYALLLPGLLMKRLFLICDLFVAGGWRPTWAWDRNAYAPAWRFGVNRMTSGLIASARPMLESALFVQALGFTSLGLYGRAVGLAHICCQKYTVLLMEAIYPALTRIEPGNPAYGPAGGLVLRGVAWLVVPLSIMLSMLAEPVVGLVYGPRWLAVVPILPWALGLMALSAVSHVAYTLLLAAQRQQRCLLADVAGLLGMGVCLVTLLPHGMVTYLKGMAILRAVVLVGMLGWLRADQAITTKGIWGALTVPTIAAVMSLLLREAAPGLMGASPEREWVLLLQALGFGVGYLAVARIVGKGELQELLNHMPLGKRLQSLLLLAT